ncbi:MAG: hypothetical protein JW838_15590 [Spirochaetes bacterium]|nr:hypothetical protein [Spirochaetota bacterium]
MKNPLLVPEFREMLASNKIEEIREFCATSPPSVMADFLGPLSAKEIKSILGKLDPDTRSAIFSYFDDDVKLSLATLFENGESVDLVARMLDEERLSFLKILPPGRQREMLALARRFRTPEAAELAGVIEQLLKAEIPEEEEMTPEEIAEEIQPLIRVYRLHDHSIVPADRIDRNCWVNIVNPAKDDLPLLAKHFKIPLDFLTASLDIDETARIETEDNTTLIIIKVPFFDEHNPDVLYFTLPIGLILSNGILITVCSREVGIIRDFIAGRVKKTTTLTGGRFILQIIFRATQVYLQYLKQINNAANMIQKKLELESKNKQLIKLLNIEKSLVYFTTSLKTNALMLERLQRLSIIRQDTEQEDLFEDIVIETRQALEMSNIYSDILSGMMDAFASVISNNLNIVLKLLTSITIIMMIPNIITSFYGMNVGLPFQRHPFAFVFVITSSFVFAIILVLFFIKKKWL